MNPLSQAIKNNNLHQLTLLIELGADIAEKPDKGKNLLDIALEFDALECAFLLISNGIKITKNNLEVAITKDQECFVKHLMDSHIMDKNDLKDNSFLFKAAKSNAKQIIDLFINFGIDFNTVDWKGRTPLFDVASSNGIESASIAEKLIDSGVNIHHKDKNRETALFEAVKNCNLEVAELLIKKGSNVNAREKDQNTPLFNIVYGFHSKIDRKILLAKLLISNGANVNAKNRFRKTPIFFAIDFDQIEIINFFIEHKADLNIESKEQNIFKFDCTPLELAERRGNKEIVKLIKKSLRHEYV